MYSNMVNLMSPLFQLTLALVIWTRTSIKWPEDVLELQCYYFFKMRYMLKKCNVKLKEHIHFKQQPCIELMLLNRVLNFFTLCLLGNIDLQNFVYSLGRDQSLAMK